MRNLALLASTAALSLALVPVAAFADDAPPVIDLVGTVILGTQDGSTLAIQGGAMSGPVTHAGPGAYEMKSGDGTLIDFKVTEKSTCVYDITFSQAGNVMGAIEVDANKVKTIKYDPVPVDANAPTHAWTDYIITLEGGDNIVQLLSPDGKLAPTQPSSTLSTSLTKDNLEAAAAQFQTAYCKPMA